MAYQYTPNVYGVYDPEKSFEENKQNGAVLTKENLDKLENQVKKNSADITVEVSNGEISESNVTFDEEQGVKKIVVKVPESVDAYTKTEVDEKISALVNGAPETADTLKELSDLISSNGDAMDLLNSAIGSKANSSDVYTKEEVDGKIPNVENKADKATTLAGYGIEDAYTKTEVDGMIPDISGKANSSDVYTKAEVDEKIPDVSGKADKSTTLEGYGIEDAYTKTEVDEKIPDVENKADKATTLAGYGIEDAYTKTEIDGKIPNVENKADKSTTLAGYGIQDAYTKSEVDSKIPDISGKADADNVYTKEEVDGKIPNVENKADKATTLAGYGIEDAYTKSEVDGKIPNVENKADKATTLAGYGIEDAYTKSEVDGMIPDISGKANSDDVYTKTQVDEKIPDISGKADTATTLAGYGIQDAYTKSEVDGKIPDISGKANSDDVYTKTQVDEKVESFVTLPSSWYTVSAGVIPESFSPRESDIFDVDPANGVFQKIVLHKNGSIGKVTTEEGEQKIVEKLPELSAEHPLIVLQVESGDDIDGVIFTSYSFYFDLFRHINTREDGVPIIAIIYWDGTTTQLAVPFGAQFVLEQSVNSGTTAKRPVLARAGQTYFDTDLGKPIFYTGTKWVDATGADV